MLLLHVPSWADVPLPAQPTIHLACNSIETGSRAKYVMSHDLVWLRLQRKSALTAQNRELHWFSCGHTFVDAVRSRHHNRITRTYWAVRWVPVPVLLKNLHWNPCIRHGPLTVSRNPYEIRPYKRGYGSWDSHISHVQFANSIDSWIKFHRRHPQLLLHHWALHRRTLLHAIPIESLYMIGMSLTSSFA